VFADANVLVDDAALTLMMMSAGITADSKRLIAARNGLFRAMKTVFKQQKDRHEAYVEAARRDSARCRSEIVDLRALCARQGAELAALRSRPVMIAVPSFGSWVPATNVPCNKSE
jgi:hypothetical protein